MTTMIERVARALCIEAGDDPDRLTYAWEMQCAGRDSAPRFRWQYWAGLARAAIEAMREMTPAMREAVEEYEKGGYLQSNGLATYEVAIDAALSEKVLAIR